MTRLTRAEMQIAELTARLRKVEDDLERKASIYGHQQPRQMIEGLARYLGVKLEPQQFRFVAVKEEK